MKNPATKNSWWKPWDQFLLPILIALVFLAFTFFYFPFREKLQFDTDEGLNLMRSLLVSLGYPLYGEVSSDQPPLFTHILAVLFRIDGPDVYRARLVVLLFSTFLVWAGAQFLQLTAGRWSAIAFLPLVVMAPRYLNLSTAVMIGLPSIAFAVASMLFVAVWHQTRSNRWLVLSGFILGLSILIKLFTGFVAPIFFAGIVISEYLHRRGERLGWKTLQPALIWGLSAAGWSILLGLVLIGPQNLWLIISPSLNASAQEVFQSERFAMNTHLQAAVPLLVLGALGTGLALYKRRWLLLYPLTWALLAYGLFSVYSPVFYHHQLLITVPMAMLAAAGVGEGIAALFSVRTSSDLARFQTIVGALAVLGFVGVFMLSAQTLEKELLDDPSFGDSELQATAGKLKVLNLMNDYIDQTNWIVTDMPMFAFRVGRPVPPILATFSQKRLSTGSLTEEDILTAMREYQPEQVLMARFEIPGLEAYLKEHYTLIASPEFYRLFLRNDIKRIAD